VVPDAQHEILGTAPSEIAPWSAIEVAQYQDTLRAFFRGLIRETGKGGIVPTLWVERVAFGLIPTGTSTVVTIDGAAVNVLRFQLVELIQAAGLERLHRCDCGRIFAKVGRRQYCSSRCQKRYYMREQRRQEREKPRRRKRHGKTTRTR